MEDFLKLKSSVDSFYALYPDLKNRYKNIDKFDCSQIQIATIERDRSYLKEVSFILHVILSIVAHPHIAIKEEEVVARIEQAKKLSNEDLIRVVRNGSLWKRHDLKMVPEKVYYYQNVDLLAIYENRFICLVIDILSRQMNEFSLFYAKMLPSVLNGGLNLDNNRSERILRYADLLKRRITYIKNTRFYKEISAYKPISRNISPTNILLKDNLYSRVYRFYKQNLSQNSGFVPEDTLREYITLALYKGLKKRGFLLNRTGEKFTNDNFEAAVCPYDNGVLLTVEYKGANLAAKHLIIPSNPTFKEAKKPKGEFETSEYISVFERAEVYNGLKIIGKIENFELLLDNYLAEKLTLFSSPSDIYTSYCPVCQAKGVLSYENIYHCPACLSRYHLSGDEIWLIRLGRKNEQ